MKKKLLSLILSGVMIASVTTIPVSAVDVSNFNDVSDNSWYYDSVKFVAERDYMNGTAASVFSPENDMTRAMFVTILSRIEGIRSDNGVTSAFTDVKTGMWYTGAVVWASQNGLVKGYNSSVFGTDDSITRQDIAVMIDRYADFKGYTFVQKSEIDSFKDVSDVSGYAAEAVEMCRVTGLFQGYPDGTLKPKENVSRAEVAALIQRLSTMIEENKDQTAAPVISPNGGTFNSTQIVTLTCPDENAEIYYTTDGSDPTPAGKKYTDPISISETTTLKAIAVSAGKRNSVIVTAVFTKGTSSGGGGTVNPPEPEKFNYRDYTITFDLAKIGGPALNIPAFDGNTNIYHVAYDENGNVDEAKSDDISLIKIMKNFSSEENVRSVLNKIDTLSYTQGGETKYIILAGEIQRVTVQKVKVAEIIDENTKQQIANAVADSSGTDVTVDDVNSVLEALDSGSTENLTEKQSEITKAVADKLDEMMSEDNEEKFIEDVKTQIEDKLGTNADEILGKLGIRDEDILGYAQEYLEKLNSLLSGTGAKERRNALSEEDINTAGGIEIKVNPAEVLIAQYGSEESEYEEAWKAVEKVFGIQRTEELKASESGKNLIAACDPAKFFNIAESADGKKTYKLKDEKEYENLLHHVIDAAEAVRQEFIIEKGKSRDEIEKMIRDAADKIDNSFIAGLLTDSNITKIAELLVAENPTILDLSDDLKESGFSKEKSVTVGKDGDIDAGSLIQRMLEKMGIKGDDLGDAKELIDALEEKLNGTYSVSMTITAEKCEKTAEH